MLKNEKRFWAGLSLLLICLFWGRSIFPYPAKCVKVTDGDTIQVLTADKKQVKIRLYGIDAPEKRQAHGKTARLYLAAHVAENDVEIEPITKDRYGRTVAIVKVGKSNICKVMVWGGYAWVYKKYCKKPFCEQWEKVEAEARAKKRGQWQDKKPVPPWEWRRNKAKK